NRFLLNLDQSARINLIQLGERWFVEVMLGSESVPVASANSPEEASALIKRIFESIRAGEDALDLEAPPQEAGNAPRPGSEPHNGRGDGRVPAPSLASRGTME
ncbi:MAG TPA: hypothetical protein VKT32_16025, partial [Chthonomonadaceae bacterium]|nr:hypothetical protein [Chthonomonadaceae bacterium]